MEMAPDACSACRSPADTTAPAKTAVGRAPPRLRSAPPVSADPTAFGGRLPAQIKLRKRRCFGVSLRDDLGSAYARTQRSRGTPPSSSFSIATCARLVESRPSSPAAPPRRVRRRGRATGTTPRSLARRVQRVSLTTGSREAAASCARRRREARCLGGHGLVAVDELDALLGLGDEVRDGLVEDVLLVGR